MSRSCYYRQKTVVSAEKLILRDIRKSFDKHLQQRNFLHSFSYRPLPLGRVAGTAVLGGIEMPHGQQQSQKVLLAPHQEWDQANSEL